jgi:hypothetical protein
MGDLTKILDGTVEEVKNAIGGMSHVDLNELRKQEAAGKKRAGVLGAIDDALKPAGGSAGDNGVAAASTIDTSGAPQQIVPDVDMDHPAVDSDPRANTTAAQNRIDFNDPTRDGHEVVEEQLSKSAD